ncbi:helix-turn-helix transcriptional regulator [Agromyces albus]|uniref:helix-turn-helix transcriptional regulator n=1 Tax=Agromyces albus TaxID=205332 RepID=UPI00277E7FEE|nr:helix-turn-helix domain-containing protein [Agromyces albus]MDQ0576450.1 putative DNA-binding transcriptional regulator AlpA [Agromyces albus]
MTPAREESIAAAPGAPPRRAPGLPVYLTPAEVVVRTGFAMQTLANWRARKVGPPYLKVGARVRYDEAELYAWMRSQPTTSA